MPSLAELAGFDRNPISALGSLVDSLKQQLMQRGADVASNPGILVDELKQRLAEFAQGQQQNRGSMQSVMPEVRDRAMQDSMSQAMNMGGLLGIVKPSVAKTLNIKGAIPDDPVFASAVSNTPNAQLTPDGLLMRVQRNQQPEQGMAESVRGGVFYLPEGAAQAKHYSTGKNGYGGQERIAGETLITNPLVAKGGTGGKAPEAAYDSLKGKGAYQSMRDDALQAIGYGRRDPQRVYEFLANHAPELENYADYIIQNSGQGNQLAYALQEAAVASAVRNAGHDAVVGISKGKSGPFLSEIFDVRESHYPDKFGGSRVWPELEP